MVSSFRNPEILLQGSYYVQYVLDLLQRASEARRLAWGHHHPASVTSSSSVSNLDARGRAVPPHCLPFLFFSKFLLLPFEPAQQSPNANRYVALPPLRTVRRHGRTKGRDSPPPGEARENFVDPVLPWAAAPCRQVPVPLGACSMVQHVVCLGRR